MPLGGKTGLINEAVNQHTNEALTKGIEYMATEEYRKSRDLNDVIPTHRKNVAKSESVVDQHFEVHSNVRKPAQGDHDDDDDDSDEELAALRASRIGKVKQQLERQAEWTSKGHGVLREIAQDEFFQHVVREKGGSDLCVVHFFHRDFQRCLVMDKHLSDLAPEMMPVKFVKINVDKAPFLVEKLRVSVLPCTIMFVNDVAADRIVGFEGLQTNEANDDLDKEALKYRLECGLGLAVAE